MGLSPLEISMEILRNFHAPLLVDGKTSHVGDISVQFGFFFQLLAIV